MSDFKPSIIQYYSKEQRNCGYCSTDKTSYSYGLHAHSLRVEDYQEMIDRGWRRCGKYCYKPIVDKSCCCLYTIRCAAKEFKLSKSQKKILKRVNNFLINGTVTKDKIHKTTEFMQPPDSRILNEKRKNLNEDEMMVSSVDASANIAKNAVESTTLKKEVKPVAKAPVTTSNSEAQRTKNKCMKAKQLRIERKRQKLQKLGFSEEEIKKKLVEKKKYPVVKTIEDYINEPLSKNPVHKLKIELVLVKSDLITSFKESAVLFAKYQQGIHHESEKDCDVLTFKNFLINSPLKAANGYGSYHQHYRLDDKLIAVGVIDILPNCVSSVYFFYDPDYAFLSLGTYGALREVEFTRRLSERFPRLAYYYMGFYIHSCIKMKYKGAFRPSYLLCPEVYSWHLIQECLPKLEKSKYSRFNEDPNARDENSDISLSDVLILYNRTAMSLEHYVQMKVDEGDYEEIMEYAKLVGKTCARRMLLFRSDDK